MTKFLKIILISIFVAMPARADVLLSETNFAEAIQKEFVEQGRDENMELEFFGGQTAFVLNGAKNSKIMIEQLKFDDEQSKFTAKAEIFADGNLHSKTTLTGKFYILGEAFVPAQEINKGDVITEDKLISKSVRLNRIKDHFVVEKEKLLGMEAKKTLKAGKLIQEREIGPVLLVRKGALVNSIYKAKGMQITAQAIAMEDGAKGQMIELENSKSHRKFSAKVVDAETVEITVDE